MVDVAVGVKNMAGRFCDPFEVISEICRKWDLKAA